jgi:Ca2+/Na+ antiporter
LLNACEGIVLRTSLSGSELRLGVIVATRGALLPERNDDVSIIRGSKSSVTKSSVMTEPVIYFGIGFLVAALLGLLVVVRVHNRERIGSVDRFRADVRQLEEQLASRSVSGANCNAKSQR